MIAITNYKYFIIGANKMSIKDEILKNLENELTGMADKFGEYVNMNLNDTTIHMDTDDVEEPTDVQDVEDTPSETDSDNTTD